MYLDIINRDRNLREDFMDWLDYECDGQEPSEELAQEFIELESMFRPALLKALNNFKLR